VPISPEISTPRLNRLSVLDLRLNRSRPFDSMIAHLWRKSGQNLYKIGLIQLSAKDGQSGCVFVYYDLILQEEKLINGLKQTVSISGICKD
jgi:hypothetical protein